MIDLAVLVATAFAMSTLGLAVFLRNTRDTTNILFGLLTLMSVFWGIANFASNHISGYDSQLFANRLSLSVGFILIQSVWLLSLYFPRKLNDVKFQQIASAIITPIIIFMMLATDKMVTSIAYIPEKGITDITVGQFYPMYVLFAGLFFVFVFFNFYRAYSSLDATRLHKQQISYAATGILLSFLWAILSAAVLPTLTNNWEISKFGTVGMFFTVALVSLSIIKHRLFDVRLIIVRAVAYTLLVVTLGGIYGLAIFGLATKLFSSDSILTQQVLPIAVALILVFTTPRLRLIFNKITNKLFYRDAYDPQSFLDELNKTMVGNIELDILLKRTTDVIQKNLKSESCFIHIVGNDIIEERVVGIGELTLNKSESQHILHAANSAPSKIIVTDQLDQGKEKLKQLLSEKKIGVVVSLNPGSVESKKPIANLIIGYKKSGNIFDSNDTKIINIISDGLLIAIQNALRFEEIKQFNITLQLKVDLATQKLRRSNEKLKALDQSKDEFISMASHQLRTPLTSIKGYTSMVLDGDAGELTPSQKELLNQAYISSQRMVYLIADLLNVSRLRSGKFILDTHPTNLANTITDEIAQVQDTASAKNQKLIFNKPKNFPELMLDETKIRQVIMNFADNAIYYTQSGGKIELILKEDRNNVYFMVKDNGLGVPKSERSKLFKKFYRATNAKKARPDGTGLGLYMAKKVIDAHGGNLIFETEEGKGSTFGFTLNKKKQRVSADN